jgi:hypothetical protein
LRAYKWFDEGTLDPQVGREWSTESWTRLSKIRWSYGGVYHDGLPGGGMMTRGQLYRLRSWVLPADRLARALGTDLWEVELAGKVERKNDILVARKGRLVRQVAAWNENTARSFARDCIAAARDTYAQAEQRLGSQTVDTTPVTVALTALEHYAAPEAATKAIRARVQSAIALAGSEDAREVELDRVSEALRTRLGLPSS